jgi:UDP-N-acetylmuramoylalanine--D-glutamate ligase
MLAFKCNEDSIVTAEQEKRTLVVGLGATGLATARFLAARGEMVRVLDTRARPPGLDALRRSLPAAEIVLGDFELRWLDGVSEVVLSPGLAFDIPLAEEARRRGIVVSSDIELFARAARAPILAVTGSNGKSTVTTLVALMLEAGGLKTARGGNLGPPALELLETPGVQAYVLEISSFQMETTEHLRPRAAAVLNISPDHLDRHGDIDRYAALKGKLARAATCLIFNWDDPRVRAMGLEHSNGVPFSSETALPRGYSIVEREGRRWLARNLEPLLETDALRIRGVHNEANALAALALCDVLGGDRTAELHALTEFRGLPHRCAWVRKHAGVDYIDDSKATNIGAMLAAVRGLPGPLILIAGGLGKGQDFSTLGASMPSKVKAAVLIGEAAPLISEALHGVCTLERAASMPDAVRAAARLAAPGDTVLLSPACASQDMFTDYRARGDAFAAAVEELGA